MRRILVLLLIIAISVLPGQKAETLTIPRDGVVLKGGFVPTAEVAQAIAEAVLVPVYGKKTVVSERPFKAVLNGGIWIVKGSVPCDGPPDAVCPGGAGEVWISKRTGQILYMTHDQ